MWDPYAEFDSRKLPNGLTVHAAHWPGRPWEAMGFLVHSGAKHDPVGLEGVAHFVEHLVSENTDMPKESVIAFFEDCGGTVNLGTTGWYPYTHYHFFVPTDKAVLSRAFSIYGHMLLLAKLEKLIERERQIIIGEFHEHYPTKLAYDLDARENWALHTGYWLERFVTPLGTPESVGRITQGALQSYYDAHYTPLNISIVGVGGMTLSELVELLCKSPFATSKNGMRTPLQNPIIDFPVMSETRYVFEMSEHIKMETPHEVGGYRSIARIPGNINTDLITVVCKMFNEALNEEIRERRAWTYAINSSYDSFEEFHQFAINCNALALGALGEIEEVIEACIVSMADREDLLEQSKRRIVASNLIIDPTGNQICNGALNDLAKYQRIISIAESSNNIAQVTMSDICNLLQWFRPERRWTRIIRP